jgi:hypothetical protein
MKGIEEKLLKSWDKKSGQKYLQIFWKWKTFQHIKGGNSIQTHVCIVARVYKVWKPPNILILFERLGRSLTSLLSSLTHEGHTHLAKWRPTSKGGRGIPPTTALWFYL